MRPRSAFGRTLTAAGLALGLTGSAQAAEPLSPLPDRTASLVAGKASPVSCATRLAAGSGVATRTISAPAEGYMTLRLTAPGGDWDLAVFDQATGTRVGASQAFGANEVVQTWARSGQRFAVQACRRAGGSATATLRTAFAVGAFPKPAPKVTVVRIPLTDTRTQVPLLMSLGFDVEETVTAAGAYANIAEPKQLSVLRAAGFAPQVVEEDLVGRIATNLRKDRKLALASRRASVLPSGRETYRLYEDYQAELKQLVADHPATVKPVTLPKKTFQGRDTNGVQISGNVNATDDQKPVSFIMGVHHAREWPAGELVQEYARYLADQYGRDARVTQLLDRVRVVIVPIVNGDGFIASRGTTFDPADTFGSAELELVEGALLPAGGTLAYRRKNCHGSDPSGALPCELAYGVDPNRNYGFKWGGPGASTSLNSQSYRGTGPWSEPETQAIHEYSQVRDVTTLMTVHTIAGLVLRPPGLSVDGKAPDEAKLKEIGDAIAADTGYKSQFSFELYDTSGTTEDWNYGAAGTFGYTVELGPSDGGFHGLYQQNVVDQWTGTGERAGKGMRSAFLRIGEAAADKGQFATVAGRAPAGRTLRLKKTFKTNTSPVCAISGPTDLDAAGIIFPGSTDCVAPGAVQSVDDKLEYTTKVNASGTFDWLVTPSTPPFTKARGMTEAWTLTCEDAGGKVFDTRQVTVDRNETQTLDLPCGGAKSTAGNGAAVTETRFPTMAPTPAGEAALAAIAATGGTAPARLRDALAPVSRFIRSRVRATRRGLSLAGTSRDRAPSGLSPRLSRVFVSIGRRTGKGCRFLTSKGRFGKKTSCLRTSYVRAKGTKRWTFSTKAKLPSGRYLAWVRGVDALKNTERKSKTRNLITFRIR